MTTREVEADCLAGPPLVASQSLDELRRDVAAKRTAVRESERLLKLERARAEQRILDLAAVQETSESARRFRTSRALRSGPAG